MIARTLKTFLLIALLIFGPGCAGKINERPENLGFNQVEFSPKKPVEWKLANGLTVLFMEDHETPKISGSLFFPGGALFEAKEISGVAAATGSQMREGGIKGLAADELDLRLDRLGAAIESSIGSEYGTVSFYCLREDFSETLRLFSGVALNPAFDENRLKLWKQLAAEGIARRRDDPSTMASLAIKLLIYGEDSPYGRVPSLESVSKISQKALKEFHEKFVRPDRAILVISGDISPADVQSAVNSQFEGWAKSSLKMAEFPEVKSQLRPGVYVLERDFDQASVMMGHLGPGRLSPDMYEIFLYNYLLGEGGFASDLFQEVRTRKGLAYDVGGGFFPGPVGGTFMLYAGTRVSQVSEAIKAMLLVTQETQQKEPSTVRLDDAKSAVTRGFVFKFADLYATVSREALRRMLGYPDDFDAKFVERINGVRSEAVLNLARSRVKTEDLAIVVVGKISPEALAAQLGPAVPVYRLSFDTVAHIAGRVGS